MTLKHMKIFVEVYNCENVTVAARNLGMTQPATSLAIKELEQYYHTKLFERSGRGIRRTSAAQHLYSNAAHLITLYNEIDSDMKNWNTKGVIRIGSSISIGTCIMPQAMKKFGNKYKELDTYIKIDSSDVVEKLVLENKLDFALIEGTVHSDKIKSRVFMEDELVPVCSRFHPLAEKKDIDIETLKDEHFLLREKNSGTRELAQSAFEIKGIVLDPVWESTSTAALVNAVSAGLGISILPKRMLEKQLRFHEICSFTIKGIDLKRHYSIIYHENKYISPVMEEFFDMLVDEK